MVNEVLLQYRYTAKNIEAGKSVNLSCWIGSREIDVYRIQRFEGDFLCILSRSEDGTESKTFAPLELVSFTISITQKPGLFHDIIFENEAGNR